ncbi:disease resistance protein (NBS-LRR class) family protein [Medicago truncatula]|uniref:Disease resistance protein (NBS-LRR class) family protein n=1 Tax=Medicago truncatula TaxID=3880 RepID=A0A072TJY8_MEDTR|nr:disease resistance protein (NBS-LRR class) family protein [Medicago truncatula]
MLGKLKILRVHNGNKVMNFPHLRLASLEQLSLSHCGSLQCFPLVVDGLLCKLKFLSVRYCRSLRSYPGWIFGLERFPPVVDGLLDELHVLNVKGCIKLKTFTPLKLANLRELVLSYCWNIESFPEVLGEVEYVTELHLDQTLP